MTPVDTAPARGALRVREVTTADGLRDLGPVWDDVLARSETSTPFLTHAWALSWWESFGAEEELHVLLLEDEQGVAGIAPLACARRAAGPLRWRALEILGTGPLRFLGMGLSDRSDLLLARRREECVATVVAWLAGERSRWDVVDLRFVPDDASTARLLPELAREAGLGLVQEPCAESPFLRLAGTWEEYLQRRGKNFRKGLKRKRAKLDEMGEVRLELDAAESRGAQLLEALAGSSLASWKAAAGSALFQHARVRAFFARLLPRLLAKRQLAVALLSVGGRVAAHELDYRMNGKLWSYDSAFGEGFAAGSPGVVLTAAVLEHAFASGLAEYDFGRGNESYKATWDTASRRELQIVLDTGTARARAARTVGYEAKWALKRRPRLYAAQGWAVGVLNRMIEGGVPRA